MLEEFSFDLLQNFGFSPAKLIVITIKLKTTAAANFCIPLIIYFFSMLHLLDIWKPDKLQKKWCYFMSGI